MNDIFLKIGHIVWIDEPLKKFYRITRREPFDYETGEEDTAIFATVASGADSGYKNIDVLEPDNDPPHLYQTQMGFHHCDNIKYYIKLPSGQNRFGVDDDKEIGFFNGDKSPPYDPDPMWTFYLISDRYPAIKCVNNSPVTITPKIYFKGMKYDITEVVDQRTKDALAAGKVPHRQVIFGGIDLT